ncbi:hypothetical protein EIN_044050 [Entamoeba invadens IP1]|uniref:Uncharacterized protein n=1 Tax=Entamoeba invadens IP1 TaxID=370355 RepID=A0A0A1TZ62_ENTIV|nr:hypothetical protein EIN_044050 [Entamoeba invadens IP1]ELP86857.1 hypothetical protein EIN_044050 [Entamoeba invadens IP1]|eukprot:XP_004253628.1 hypothetical protein EIN_044050 [Entamoeba invadens IP1]
MSQAHKPPRFTIGTRKTQAQRSQMNSNVPIIEQLIQRPQPVKKSNPEIEEIEKKTNELKNIDLKELDKRCQLIEDIISQIEKYQIKNNEELTAIKTAVENQSLALEQVIQ